MSSIGVRFNRAYGAIAFSLKNSFLFIALFNFIIFLPSLGHYFFSDDWMILAAGKYGTGQFSSGDASLLLFRPFFYSVLYAEYFFFGNSAFLWHVSGLLFHLLALFMLLQLLRKITSKKTAFFLTLNFSCLTLNAHAVIWANANSYILFFASLLGLFYYLISYGENLRAASLSGAAFYSLIACFFYENGVIASLAAIFYLRQALRVKGLKFSWQREGVLFVPVILYALTFFIFNFRILTFYTSQTYTLQAQSPFLTGLTLAPVLIAWWTLGLLFPSAVLWSLPAKLGRLLFQLSFYPVSAGIGLNFFVALVLAASMLLAVSKERVRRHLWFITSLGLLVLFYAFAIAAGRGSANGLAYTLDYNGYYCYIFSGYLTILAACLIDPVSFSSGVKKVVLPLAIIFILLNAFYSFKVNCFMYEESKIFFQYKKYLNDFITEHATEPDFSLDVKNDVTIPFTRPPLSLAETFCGPRYLRKINPKYTLDMHEADFYKTYKRSAAKPPKVWYGY